MILLLNFKFYFLISGIWESNWLLCINLVSHNLAIIAWFRCPDQVGFLLYILDIIHALCYLYGLSSPFQSAYKQHTSTFSHLVLFLSPFTRLVYKISQMQRDNCFIQESGQLLFEKQKWCMVTNSEACIYSIMYNTGNV